MESLKGNLANHFGEESLNRCLSTIDKLQFGVRDDKENDPVYITAYDEGAFKVRNPNRCDISFWRVDKCTYNSTDGKRCDCGFWDDEKFILVELKTETKPRKRAIRRKEAYKQLSKTFEEISQLIPGHFSREAIVCFDFKSDVPAIKTGSQQKSLEFQEEFNAELLQGNSTIF